jgi:hypothetical protein
MQGVPAVPDQAGKKPLRQELVVGNKHNKNGSLLFFLWVTHVLRGLQTWGQKAPIPRIR